MTFTKEEALALLGGSAVATAVATTEKTAPVQTQTEKPVRSSARIASHGDRRKTVQIRLDIEKDWYVYGKPVSFPYMTPLAVDVRGGGVQEVLDITFPKFNTRIYGKGAPANAYERSVVIEVRLLMKRDTPADAKSDDLRVLLRYQPCSRDGNCLLPVSTAYRV